MQRMACVILCALSMLLFVGCDREEKQGINDTADTAVSEQDKDDTGTGKQSIYEKMEFTNSAEGVLAFAADGNGDVYVLGQDGILTGYEKNGSIKKTYPDCLDFMAMCCDNGMIYAYDAVKEEITALNTADGSRKTVLKDMYAQEVLKIVKLGDALYVLAIPKSMQSMAGNHDYQDFGECLYKVSLTDGKREKLPVDGIIAIYASELEDLYYYAYQDETYVLCWYDTESGKSGICYDMMTQFGIKYLSAFVFEPGVFAYAELNSPAIHVISTGDGREIKKTDEVMLLSGNDMDCIKGNIVYSGYPADGRENFLQSFYLLDEDVSSGLTERKPGKHPEEYYVKWAVPKGCTVSDRTLDEINYMLEQAGAGYGLKILEKDESDYQANLDKSDADIAFIGFDFEGANTAVTALEEGKYACLDEFLQDSRLYEAIPEILWDTVKYQGGIYYVPSEAPQNCGVCVIFDTDKIPVEKAEAFDGDIFTLAEYLPEGERLYCDLESFYFAETFGYVYDKGILLSDDGSAVDPFEDERCVQWLRTLNQWYADGRAAYGSNSAKQCAIRLTRDIGEAGEHTYKYAWKGSACPRLNMSVGIRAASPKKEEAFRFLELVHTDPAYGNLLVFGKEALDAGSVPAANWVRQLVFGLDTGLLSGASGLRHFASIEEKKQYYEEHVTASPSLYMEFPEECLELQAIENKYLVQMNITRSKNFEEQLLKFQEELRPVMKRALEKIAKLNQ